MTKKTRNIIDRGIRGSIKEQEKLFHANFLTRFLLRRADKLGKKDNAF